MVVMTICFGKSLTSCKINLKTKRKDPYDQPKDAAWTVIGPNGNIPVICYYQNNRSYYSFIVETMKNIIIYYII